jgi:hypothetical protein
MRAIFILPVVLSAIAIIQAQDYVPFPTENAHWNIYLEYGGQDSPPDTFLIMYTLGGDTVINSKKYTQLRRERDDTAELSNEYHGVLRKDEKKIYYLGDDYFNTNKLSQYEILLYDFSAELYDTIIHVAEHPQFQSIIINIDSVFVGSSYRKRYEINSSQNFIHPTEYWIEGIGSVTNGLLGHITSIPTCCYHYWEHVCFKDTGIEYVNPNFDSCNAEKPISNSGNPDSQGWYPIGAKWYFNSQMLLNYQALCRNKLTQNTVFMDYQSSS